MTTQRYVQEKLGAILREIVQPEGTHTPISLK